jgi:hypothetical protein
MQDLMGFVNTIITQITNGNNNEKRLVHIMGGTVIETESEKLIRKGQMAGSSDLYDILCIRNSFCLNYDHYFSKGVCPVYAGYQ